MKELIDDWRGHDHHIKEIGYVRLESALITFLVSFGPYVEIGAGTGALTQAIETAGGSSFATDNFSWPAFQIGDWQGCPTSNVAKLEASEAVRSAMDRDGVNILCAWPSRDEDWCYRAVSLIRRDRLFAYIGEGRGGCTGDSKLHDLLDDGFEQIHGHPVRQYAGFRDHCTVYRRL